MTDARRSDRVAERVRACLVEAFQREMGDPGLSSMVVTTVEVPADLSMAKVGVRLLVGDEDPALRRRAVLRLSHATARLRKELAPRLGLRRVPELRFFYDTTHDAARRVAELLAEIDAERVPKRGFL
ncbi:MAG TPA: 30S ribosome-binding factor RbfA [Polyangiaceae bacterium]|jgi:ribosome-binding factor A